MKRFPLWSFLAPFTLVLAILVLAVDQTHKWWMLKIFDIESRQPVAVTPFFEMLLTWNRGISYGLFRTPMQGLLIAVSILISLVLWSWACRSTSRLTVAALAVIIGGALSNALDRALYGAVADFFHFHVGNFSWYIFNIADVAIVAGVAILLYESLFLKPTHGSHGNA